MWKHLNRGISTPLAIMIILILSIAVGAFAFWQSWEIQKEELAISEIVKLDKKTALEKGPLNIAYIIENESFALQNGFVEKEIAPGSASKLEVRVFGEPTFGDLNGDGVKDAALILTYNSGGSGTFYYVAAALRDKDILQYTGTNGFFLGDRIAPQNISIEEEKIMVNYADRAEGESMATQPSLGVTGWFIVEGKYLKAVKKISLEESCQMSGGEVSTSICCKTAEDFPDTCLIGACGCSPENSKEVKVCDCGNDKCFDGNSCR